tara:strand:+ start:460 stop:747 length:288 start_codon:yes stop_codon:yes gene_type:complete
MLTKKKEIKFKINGLIDKPKYQSLVCTCSKDDVLHQHPNEMCYSCYCNIAWDSVPKESFNVIVKNKKGKSTKTITEITLHRDSSLDRINGWSWIS